MKKITVIWDEEAKAWKAVSEDIPGLSAQAGTFEELRELLPGMAADLLSAGGWPGSGHDPVPLEILARYRCLAFPGQPRAPFRGGVKEESNMTLKIDFTSQFSLSGRKLEADCPKCGQKVQFALDQVGGSIICPGCNVTIELAG